MKKVIVATLSALCALGGLSIPVGAEILAMLNYESKPDDDLKALGLPGGPENRREGIAIVDVDPASANFGKIMVDMPLPNDLVAHHIFYNKDASKAYVTALGKPELRIMDMTRTPYPIKILAVPDCQVGEDVVFSADNTKWYLTCMGSNNIVVGDATSDQVTKVIATPAAYPHGIAVHDGIDRILVTNTVRATDLGDAGEVISVLEMSTGKVMSSHKLSSKPSPAGEAPVEVVFVPGSNPPVAYATNMFGGTLWTATWNAAKQDFDVQQAFDFAETESGVPLEIYFNKTVDRLYVTTAKPGQLHVFELGADPGAPKLLKTMPAAEGAHHVAFTADGKYAIVQNSLLNLPGMSDGSLTLIDLNKEAVIASIDTFKKQGLNPNCIVLLPQWNDPAGH